MSFFSEVELFCQVCLGNANMSANKYTLIINSVKPWQPAHSSWAVFPEESSLFSVTSTLQCVPAVSKQQNHKQGGLAAICGQPHSARSLSHIVVRPVMQQSRHLFTNQLFRFVYSCNPFVCIFCWLLLLQAMSWTLTLTVERGKNSRGLHALLLWGCSCL